ncbi:MAG: potassium channel protein [Pirellulales bacterium]|nr:potassium channel protein [Pirellulales bacterium]
MKSKLPSKHFHLRVGLLLLSVVFIVGVLGYRLAGWGWIDSFYMVVILLSTVGLEEVHDLSHSPGMEIFTAVLIIFGVSTALYIIGAFVQMMTEGEINRALGLQRVTREIRRLRDHVIICGFGRMGEILAQQLESQGKAFCIVDDDAERITEATEQGYLALNDNATEEEALEQAGVMQAHALVTTLPKDADNVFITLTARNLNRDLQIIARGEFPTTEKKLLQAGANRVVLPAATGALRMAAMITRPSILELVELVAGRHVAEVEVAELKLPQGCSLVGKTLGESHIRSRHELLVVAVRHGEQLHFAPGAKTEFQTNDRLIVMGQRDDIERFRQEHQI